MFSALIDGSLLLADPRQHELRDHQSADGRLFPFLASHPGRQGGGRVEGIALRLCEAR
jgi:hypothetical protein